MQTEPATTLQLFNAQLDQYAAQRGLDSFKALADDLGMSTKTLLYLRQGNWTKMQQALITVLLSSSSPESTLTLQHEGMQRDWHRY